MMFKRKKNRYVRRGDYHIEKVPAYMSGDDIVYKWVARFYDKRWSYFYAFSPDGGVSVHWIRWEDHRVENNTRSLIKALYPNRTASDTPSDGSIVTRLCDAMDRELARSDRAADEKRRLAEAKKLTVSSGSLYSRRSGGRV